eukprot:2397274-Prymnesium_polylepis.1
MRTEPAADITCDCSLEYQSPSDMCATYVFESLAHFPILCGFFCAYALTGPATRRSELPSRSTGLTAEPRTLAYLAAIAFSSSVFGDAGYDGIAYPLACRAGEGDDAMCKRGSARAPTVLRRAASPSPPLWAVEAGMERSSRAPEHGAAALRTGCSLPVPVSTWRMRLLLCTVSLSLSLVSRVSYLQLLDGLNELRDGGGDVGQLDDVGRRRLRKLAQLAQLVRHALLRLEGLREQREDAAGDGDVRRGDLDASRLAEALDDREQRVRRERGRLIRVRPATRGSFDVSAGFVCQSATQRRASFLAREGKLCAHQMILLDILRVSRGATRRWARVRAERIAREYGRRPRSQEKWLMRQCHQAEEERGE